MSDKKKAIGHAVARSYDSFYCYLPPLAFSEMDEGKKKAKRLSQMMKSAMCDEQRDLGKAGIHPKILFHIFYYYYYWRKGYILE